MNEALRDWVTNVDDTFYCIGTVAGPHPYPMMVRDFQSIIGRETREQMQEAEGRLPDSLVACIGGGSNAMGLFHPFLDEPEIEIYGVEAAGHGLDTAQHAASIAGGRPGVLHGNRTYLLMNERRPDRRGAFDLGRPRLSRHRARACLAQRCRPRQISFGDRRRGARTRSSFSPSSKASFRRWSRPTPSPRCSISRRRSRRTHLMVVNLSGRGDKDLDYRGAAPRRRQERDDSARIDRRFAALKQEGRAALVTFTMAGDPDEATSLAILKALPQGRRRRDRARHAVHRSDGGRAGDPGGRAARAEGRAGHEARRSRVVREFRAGDDATPIVLMGYYNPIYIYGVERFLADAKSAGVDGLIIVDLPPEEDAELCLPALQGRTQFHPPRHADDRRQAAAGRAREHVGLCLLRLDHRHHRRQPRPIPSQVADGGRAHQAPHQAAGLRRLRRAHRRAGARASPTAPTASWSARRWSMRCARA